MFKKRPGSSNGIREASASPGSPGGRAGTIAAWPRRWVLSAAALGVISVLVAVFPAAWDNPASASTQGTLPTHAFSFNPGETTLDAVTSFQTVTVSLSNLNATIVANTVQVTVVHDPLVLTITGPVCTDLYATANVATARIDSEGATTIVCTTTGAPPGDADGDGLIDGLINGDLLQFTLTRVAPSEDTTLSFIGTGPWQTNVVDQTSTFFGTPSLGTMNVLKSHAPVANPQSIPTLEDQPAPITLTGTDVNGDALTFAVVTGPLDGVLSGTVPNLTYTPTADFNGTDSFTFTVDDGLLTSPAATIDLTITAVNDQPTFTPGPNLQVLQGAAVSPEIGWATNISAGPVDEEAAQVLTFSTTGNTNPTLFSVAPSVDLSGTLAYTPDPTRFGTATITIQLADDGGTANGGVDTFSAQFDIEVLQTHSTISGAIGSVSYTGGIDTSVFVPKVSVLDAGVNVAPPVDVNPDGSFSIPGVPTGTYTVRVELAGYQTGEAFGVVVNGGDITMSTVSLFGGYVNGDEIVDGGDLSLVLFAFNTIPLADRTDGFGNVIDLNGDGLSHTLDIDIMSRNFGGSRIVLWSAAS